MEAEPADQFFTNWYIYSQIEEKRHDNSEAQKLESKLKNGR